MQTKYEDDVPDYKGRIFIVGNGPSLAKLDLNRLIGEESWAMNHIYLLYPSFDWRPTRWWWNDHPQRKWQLDRLFAYVREYAGTDIWVRDDVGEMLLGDYRPFGDDLDFFDEMPNYVTVWKRCNKHISSALDPNRRPPEICWPDGDVLCKPGSGLGVLIQQAVKENYNPIYLLGCDAGFWPGKPHHMVEGYNDEFLNMTEDAARGTNAMLLWMHKQWEAWAAKNRWDIFNVNGKIQAHPKIAYDTLFRAG